MNDFVQVRFICKDVSACDALVAAENNENEKWGVAVTRLPYCAPARKVAPKTSSALKAAAAVLALVLSAGNAWAAPSCARPQDMTALRTAALQQQLMVAALSCHAVADYNRFVISYRSELQESDKALMNFFLQQDAQKGADNYNEYKTRLANTSSLRSLRDPKFCRSAKLAFDVALNRKGSLAKLESERPPPIETGYASCLPGAPEPVLMADATPRSPMRHRALPERQQALPDSPPSSPIVAFDSTIRPSPKPSFRVAQASRVSLPPHGNVNDSRKGGLSQARDSHERDARDRDADTRVADNRDADERNDFDRDGTEAHDDADAGNDVPRYSPRYAEMASARANNRRDYGFSGNARGTSGFYRVTDNLSYADEPRPRMVLGRDGHWYLLLYDGR